MDERSNNVYIIPANSKKSQLILSYFTLSDLILFGIGAGFSLLAMLSAKGASFTVMILLALPAVITGFLILPLPPYYHNIRTVIGNFNRYMFGIKKYYWRGWCASYGDGRKK